MTTLYFLFGFNFSPAAPTTILYPALIFVEPTRSLVFVESTRPLIFSAQS